MTLKDFFVGHPKCALAFSGGVDSACLLQAGISEGADIRAYFLSSSFQPSWEKRAARELAERLGAGFVCVECDVLADPIIASNDSRRCYHCKRRIFSELKRVAEADGYAVLIDGTNASDDASDRPGMKALEELGVLSPLRMCGLGKKEVRRLMRDAGMPGWDRPSYSCLATRIPADTRITSERLAAVESAEGLLMSLGFSDFRVRWHDGCARLEVTEDQMRRAVDLHGKISDGLSPCFSKVLLDLAPRRRGL